MVWLFNQFIIVPNHSTAIWLLVPVLVQTFTSTIPKRRWITLLRHLKLQATIDFNIYICIILILILIPHSIEY
ncbi:hypothetical protein MA16_Dca013155 [Dendrobium catenatum]|uniref:Uncharacterized protein n=1 Tax=Dendrobium catenatum TaxID=906689 RepID=A0A2I0WR11_9ASPA|nr:hypothetical protein MA16_Dca013155 [Dendrobium catenatum]